MKNQKNKIKTGKFLLAGIFFMLIFSSLLSAQSYSKTSFGYLQKQGIGFQNYFDEGMCQEGQDFIIQVAPFGCEPAVVRSDLLEEQNVPVFCQLAATKINPLIDVEAIDSISFKSSGRQYSDEVAGVGFHPAKAAVRGTYKTLLNSPVMENIGYAVIVLKKQRNESSMPDWVEGTLTADIRYDIKNAFGIGKATYYLPEFESDEEWGRKHNQYSFWDGKGFLRAEGIDENSAVVSVYTDENKKISSVNLKKGQTSDKIFLPGFYCMAGLQLRLDGLENPDTRAKLNINGEIVEVTENEKFLENKCVVKDIEKQGLVQRVQGRCKTDEGSESFDLRISPEVELLINGEPKKAQVGDIIDVFPSVNDKKIFLGYIGENNNGKFIVPMASTAPTKEEFLDSFAYKSLSARLNAYQYKSGIVALDILKNFELSFYGSLESIGSAIFSGAIPLGSYYLGKGSEIYDIAFDFSSQAAFGIQNVHKPQISFIGFHCGNKSRNWFTH